MTEKHARTLDYYMGFPYTVEVQHDEDGYFAKVLELPGWMTSADTSQEFEYMVEDAMRSWIGCGLEHGDPIPEPTRGDERYCAGE